MRLLVFKLSFNDGKFKTASSVIHTQIFINVNKRQLKITGKPQSTSLTSNKVIYLVSACFYGGGRMYVPFEKSPKKEALMRHLHCY